MMPKLFRWQMLAKHLWCAYQCLRQDTALLLLIAAVLFPSFINRCDGPNDPKIMTGHMDFYTKKEKTSVHGNCWKPTTQHVESTEFLAPSYEAKKHIVTASYTIPYRPPRPLAQHTEWQDLNITFFLQNGWTFYSPVFSRGTSVSIHINYTPWAPLLGFQPLPVPQLKDTHAHF